MEKSESIKNLATALCNFQSAVDVIKKGNINPFFKSKYASLSDILDIIREPLAANGLSFAQFPKDRYGLDTILMHTSGEWISASYEMEPTKKDPQGAGSVITYQRRYALGAILGLQIDEDDDANKASEPPKKIVKEVLTPDHVNYSKVVAFLKGTGTMTEVLKKYTISKEVEEQLINDTL